jgi:multiple sugar transport system permease protein
MSPSRSWSHAILRHGVLACTSLIMLAPFLWMLLLSTKPPSEMFEVPFRILPRSIHLIENYRAALEATPLLRILFNGVVVTAGILALQILTGAPIAYALAKLEFPGRQLLFWMVLIALLIPSQALALPLYILFYYIGILDSYLGLILPSAVSPFAIFLLRQFFKSVPDELIHAARLDGLSELSIIWRVMVPLALPAVVAFGTLSVVVHWNDLFWPSIIVQRPELATPPLAVVFFKNAEAGDAYGPLMAAAALIIAPPLIAFLVAQRRFIEGLTSPHLK